MNLKPLGDHVVIQPAEKEAMTKSGIVLPGTGDKERPERGTVLAIGPGKMSEDGKRLPIDVKVGDTVLFKKYSPDEFKLDEKEYLVVSASDLIAIIE